jgi:hypothetical protein
MEFALNRPSNRWLMTPVMACVPQEFFFTPKLSPDRRTMEDSLFIPACAYRRIEPSEPGEDLFVVCGCPGGVPIGLVNGNRGKVAEICGSCNIPAVLDPPRRPCLFLVPARIWEGDALRTRFSCRWFASLKPKFLPSEVWIACFGCPHWFPRPPEEEAVPGIERWIRKVIRMYWEPKPDPDPSEKPQCQVPDPIDFIDRISARIRRLRVAPAVR